LSQEYKYKYPHKGDDEDDDDDDDDNNNNNNNNNNNMGWEMSRMNSMNTDNVLTNETTSEITCDRVVCRIQVEREMVCSSERGNGMGVRI